MQEKSVEAVKGWRVLAIPWWENETYWCLGLAPSTDIVAVFDGRVGTGGTREILAIAEAIDKGTDVCFKRCAVRCLEGQRVELWSPRDPHEFRVIVSMAEAKLLAKEIRRAVAEDTLRLENRRS